MNRAIGIFILFTITSWGALNILYPKATLNLLLALGIGIVVAYLDDYFKISIQEVNERNENEI